MAGRRAVDNLLALAVLGTVVTRPMHPYEMASVMRARGKDDDMPIRWGSLYRVVQNLAKHGFLRPLHSERQGGRPERTVYAITDAGRAELVDWVRDLVGSPDHGVTGFRAGLSLLGALHPDDVGRLLDDRVAELSRRVEAGQARLTALAAELPELFLVETDYELTVLEAELRWAQALAGRIHDGVLPGLEQWRAFATTGEVSPDVARLAERGTDPT